MTILEINPCSWKGTTEQSCPHEGLAFVQRMKYRMAESRVYFYDIISVIMHCLFLCSHNFNKVHVLWAYAFLKSHEKTDRDYKLKINAVHMFTLYWCHTRMFRIPYTFVRNWNQANKTSPLLNFATIPILLHWFFTIVKCLLHPYNTPTTIVLKKKGFNVTFKLNFVACIVGRV